MSKSEPMEPSVFTRIINGELPGRFVWRDEHVVAFLTIAPLKPGHTLVLPVRQIDHWLDVPPPLWARLAEVQQHLGNALMTAYNTARIGSIIAGLEVPHCHVHLVPFDHEYELSFANIDPSPDPADLDSAAELIRATLREAGHEAVPED